MSMDGWDNIAESISELMTEEEATAEEIRSFVEETIQAVTVKP